jgi:Lrp/AsnC family transcriptional regulator for asnA, asnC and gidA
VFRATHALTDELELAPALSALERAAIRALQADGRTPYAQIAAELGMAEKSVRLCVDQLRERGVIHITTVVDPRIMGYTVIALLGVRIDPALGIEDVTARLAEIPGAFYVAMVSGRFNVVMELYCADMEALGRALNERIRPIRGVTSVEVFPYLRLHYRFPAFEAAWQKDVSSPGGMSARLGPADVDEMDRRIIAILYEDGRASFRSVGRRLGVSESQVRRRVGRLTDSGALRIMALTVPAGVGFHTAAFVMISVRPGESIEATAARLARLPAIIYVAICAGDFEILAEVVCTDHEELLRVLDAEIRSLPGIRKVEPWLHIRLHYRIVRPSEFLDVAVSSAMRFSADEGPDLREAPASADTSAAAPSSVIE